MPRFRRKILDKAVCQSIANKCKTRTEFARTDASAYKKSCNEGWIVEFFPNTIYHAKWTKKSCKRAALSCNTRNEFKKKFSAAWREALRNGWLDDWLPKEHKNVSYERCHEAASQCKSKTEFRKKYGHLYNAALHGHWVDRFAKEFNYRTTHECESIAQRKYLDDDVRAVAKRFKKLSEFRKQAKRMYDIAYERKLLPSFTWLKRNEEVVANGFVDCVYVYEFIGTKTAYIGRTVNKQHRDNAHRNNAKDCVRMYADQIKVPVPVVKYLADQISPQEGSKYEAMMMQNYLNNGWTLLNKQKFSGLGTLTRVSKKECIDFAKRFEYWNDLYKASTSKFNMLRKNGWDKECVWLKDKKAKNGTWSRATLDQIKNESSKYHNRTEFMRCSKTAYERARSQGWVDILFPVSNQRGIPKPVAACDPLTGAVMKTYTSIKDAAKDLKTMPQTITSVLKGRRKKHRGYTFKYI